MSFVFSALRRSVLTVGSAAGQGESEPNSNYVNNLYPLVDSLSAVFLASDSNGNATVSQRVRDSAGVFAILRFGIGDFGDRPQP